MVQLKRNESSHRAVHLGDERDGSRRLCTIAPHLLALALPPVGVEDGVDLRSEDGAD